MDALFLRWHPQKSGVHMRAARGNSPGAALAKEGEIEREREKKSGVDVVGGDCLAQTCSRSVQSLRVPRKTRVLSKDVL